MHSRRTVIAIRALGTAAAILASAVEGQAAGWHRDVATAEAEARRLDRPLLLHFYADWCGPCKKMEQEALSSPDLLRQLGTRFVGVKVNSDRHQDLVKSFNIDSLPSDVVVAPDGKVLAQTTGYQDERSYLARLARIDSRFTQMQKLQLARQGNGAPDPGGMRPVDAGSGRPGGDSATFVGLNGFSPVALFERRDWVKGKQELTATHEGVVYLFSTDAEVSLFASNPRKFAPRLLGCDPVVLSETERAIPGSTKFGAYFEGELYLFISSATRDQFRKEPERFARTIQTVGVDQVEFRRLK